MKKIHLFAGFLLLSLLSGMFTASLVGAADFRGGDNTRVEQQESVEGSLFITGRSIDIAGEVDGDVFCGGQNITISGTIRGDVLCAGMTIRITGVVEGDVRLAGQTITLESEVQGSATVVGQTFTLDDDASIGRDLTIGSSDAFLDGTVGRDVSVGSSNLVIANTIGRDITGDIAALELTAGANVAGNIEYTSGEDLVRNSAATVGGTITRIDGGEVGASKRGALLGFGILWFIYWIVAASLIAIGFAFFFPAYLRRATDHGLNKPWRTILIGFAASFAVPIAIFLIALSVVGIPLAIFLGFTWITIILLSSTVSSYYIGRRVLQDATKHPIRTALFGTIILTTLYFIPFIGMAIFFVTLWAGSGMILTDLFYHRTHTAHKPKKKVKTATS